MGKDNVFAQFVNFHNAELHILTHQRIEIADGMNVDLGAWQESINPHNIHYHTPLDAPGDESGDDCLLLMVFEHFLPSFHKISLALGKHQLTFLVFNFV